MITKLFQLLFLLLLLLLLLDGDIDNLFRRHLSSAHVS